MGSSDDVGGEARCDGEVRLVTLLVSIVDEADLVLTIGCVSSTSCSAFSQVGSIHIEFRVASFLFLPIRP